jgi:hypothetical protein
LSLEQVFEYTAIDPWFLVQIQDIVKTEAEVKQLGVAGLTADRLRSYKRKGLSDLRLANARHFAKSNCANSVGAWACIRSTNA